MASNRASVSAIITAYNHAAYIADAVASVRSQTTPPSEIVIVDDGSTDETPAIVDGLGADIRYDRQTNLGEGSARNRGIELVRGDVVAFLDADDAWPSHRLQTLLQALADDVEIVCGRGRAFREDTWVDAQAAATDRPEGHMMSFGCSLIRRRVFDRVGAIDTARTLSVDLDWFLRCRELAVSIVVINDVVLLYRRHDRNMTNDMDRGRDRLMQTARQALERRRCRDPGVTVELPPWETLGRRQP